MVADDEDVQESLRILLATLPGERVMQERFGCDLGSFLFEEVDQGLKNAVTRLVRDAILYHEPRVELERVAVTESRGEGDSASPGGKILEISIRYTTQGTNSRYNMVFPFYLDEATFPG